MAQIYFGEIDYDGADVAFVFEGKFYDFVLEVTEDQVVIRDCLGRFIPLDHFHALKLSKALNMANNDIAALALAKCLDLNTQIACD